MTSSLLSSGPATPLVSRRAAGGDALFKATDVKTPWRTVPFYVARRDTARLSVSIRPAGGAISVLCRLINLVLRVLISMSRIPSGGAIWIVMSAMIVRLLEVADEPGRCLGYTC